MQRLFSRQVNGTGRPGFCGRQYDRKYIYNRFRFSTSLSNEEIDTITCVRFHPRGKHVFCGTDYGEMHIFDIREEEQLGTHALGVMDGIRFANGIHSDLMLAWYPEPSVCRLWSIPDDLSSRFSTTPLLEFPHARCAVFSYSNDMIIGTTSRDVRVYDAETGAQMAKLADPLQLEEFDIFEMASMNPYNDLVLCNAVLWDFRMPHRIVHRFDKLSKHGTSNFHPNGNEVIVSSEIWDIRTFKLLTTCAALRDNKGLEFSSRGDVIYSMHKSLADEIMLNNGIGDNTDNSTVFRTIDALTYEPITSFDTEREVLDMSIDSNDAFVALVLGESSGFTDCRVYEVGRRRREEDEEEEEEEEEDEDEDEDEEMDEEDEEDLFSDIMDSFLPDEEEFEEFDETYFVDEDSLPG